MSTRRSLAVALTLMLNGLLIVAAAALIAVVEPEAGLMKVGLAFMFLIAMLAVPALAWHLAPYLSPSLRQQLETKRRLQTPRPRRTVALPSGVSFGGSELPAISRGHRRR